MYDGLLKLVALNHSEAILFDLDLTPTAAQDVLKETLTSEHALYEKRLRVKEKTANKYQLYYRSGPNGWRRKFHFSFEKTSYGTCLIGQFRASMYIIVSTFFFINLMLWVAILTIGWVQPPNRQAAWLFPLSIIFIARVGRFFSKQEEKKALAILQHIFDTQIIKTEIPKEYPHA